LKTFKSQKKARELLVWINSEANPNSDILYNMRKLVAILAIETKTKNYYYNKKLELALIHASLRRLNCKFPDEIEKEWECSDCKWSVPFNSYSVTCEEPGNKEYLKELLHLQKTEVCLVCQKQYICKEKKESWCYDWKVIDYRLQKPSCKFESKNPKTKLEE
jgi:hypothetical protein